jgi:hypothetical protein
MDPNPLVDQVPGAATASVVVPKFTNEEELLEVNLEELETLFRMGGRHNPKLRRSTLASMKMGICHAKVSKPWEAIEPNSWIEETWSVSLPCTKLLNCTI